LSPQLLDSGNWDSEDEIITNTDDRLNSYYSYKINKKDTSNNTLFRFANTVPYTYKVLFSQALSTPSGSLLETVNNIVSGDQYSHSIYSSINPRQGISNFDYNENCYDSAGIETECEKIGYTNYLIFKFTWTENIDGTETDVNRYRAFSLDFDSTVTPTLKIHSPFTSEAITTDSNSATQNINLEEATPYELKFYTNDDYKYDLKLRHSTTAGTETLTDISNGSTTAYQISTANWDKTCGDTIAATDDTPEHPACDDYLNDESLFFELKVSDQDDTNLFTYTIPVILNKDLNIIWENPIHNKENSDFIKVNFTSTEDSESDLAYLYPYKTYVELDENSIKFEPTHASKSFKSEAKFIYLNSGQSYESNFSNRHNEKQVATSLTSSESAGKQRISFTWDKSCSDAGDACTDPKFVEPAIEVLVTSLNTDGSEGNTTSYVFPLSFTEQAIPEITVTAPVSETEGETPILAANTTSTTLELETDIPAVCQASSTNGFTLDSEEALNLSPNPEKTNHSLSLDELENETSYTYYIKCFNPEDPSKIGETTINFAIDKDFLNLTWQSPSATDEDFEIAHQDGETDLNHTYLYQETLSANSLNSTKLELGFTNLNSEISYKSYIASLDEDFDPETFLEDIPESRPSGFKSLSTISGNDDEDYRASEVAANTANQIEWDKQCYDSDTHEKVACPKDKTNLLLLEVETTPPVIEDDPATEGIDESELTRNSETYWYFFPLSISDDPLISECELSGDEIIFNPILEDELFSFSQSSENVANLEATIEIEKTDGTTVGQVYNGDLSSATGEYAWNGQIDSSNIDNGKYTAVLTINDKDSDLNCQSQWNFLVNDKAPAIDGDLTLSLSEEDIILGQTTSTVTIATNKDSFKTVVNIYDNMDRGIATLYKCEAGIDTSSATTACPRTVSFEWDGSHQLNYLDTGRYYLKGTMKDLNGIHLAGLSENFNIKEDLTQPRPTNPNTPVTNEDGNCNTYFTDIYSNDPSCAAVSYVRETGIFLGTDRNTIELNAPITRLEMITVTNRIKELKNPGVFSQIESYHPVRDGNMGFIDLSVYVNNVEAKWFMDEIWKAKQLKSIKGYQDGTIKPNQYISGPETFKLIQLALEANSSSERTNPWYQDYLSFNYVNNLNTAGIQEVTPAVTRGQVINYLYSLNQAGY